MDTRFTDKVALVTGGASGIGAAVVDRLLAEGARVVAADLHPGEGTDALESVGADVTDSASVRAACERAVERFGGLDVVVHAAGGARLGTILDGDEDDWRATVDLVLGGTYLVTRHAARVLRRSGAIVHVASLNAHVPLYGASSYAAAKAGVEVFTKNAALELADRGIRVNAVLPGLVRTPLTRAYFDGGSIEQDFRSRILAGRPAEPAELAATCAYLASDDASYVNGTSLVVDGGWEVTNYPDLRPVVHGSGL